MLTTQVLPFSSDSSLTPKYFTTYNQIKTGKKASTLKASTLSIKKIVPKPLQKGDLIALVFPASYTENYKEKVKWLEALGYRTIIYPSEINPLGYLSGTDTIRGEALMNAWRNEEVRAILAMRGGYGSARILDLLDYEWIKSHPKIFLGMSDITALHAAIRQKTSLVTFLSPPLVYSPLDIDFFLNEWEKTICEGNPREIPLTYTPTTLIQEGYGEGAFTGGNLSILASLCGTKWQIDTTGKILILEDIHENTYRIDRMLWQMKESGLLDDPSAVILSSFPSCEGSRDLKEVFYDYFKDASYPVLYGFPSGHIPYQTTIPLGALGQVNTKTLTVTILERCVCKE